MQTNHYPLHQFSRSPCLPQRIATYDSLTYTQSPKFFSKSKFNLSFSPCCSRVPDYFRGSQILGGNHCIEFPRREKKMYVKAAQSSFRDRTHEFHNITERLKKSGSGPTGPSSSSHSRSEEQRSAIANQSDFNRRASKIGFGIHQTSQKLAKLAKCKQMTIRLV
ncbi:hypothetical protein V8G54_008039 [Vigna mungo]|uniref:Syntaxin-5 N-terminal Sly1p-binding domain-containing protein n=1 Tax=Vigna mungo TaxID=3915 RepID=A0AAQ3S7V6_VIGMU